MIMKFFRSADARHATAGFPFEIYDINCGVAVGVYATDDAKAIAALEKLAKDQPWVFSVLSPEEYGQAKKKVSPNDSENLRILRPSPPQEIPLKGNGAVVVEDTEPQEQEQPVEIIHQVETAEAALRVESLAAPKEEPAPVSKPKSEKRRN
jgi:hypothetical protein